MNARQTRTLEAFLRAISSHPKPISTQIQQEIRRIGQDLYQRDTHSLGDIPQLVKQDTDLQEQYEQIYRQLQSQYISQERTKSLSINGNGIASIDSEIQLAHILTSDNLIQATQEFIAKLDRQTKINNNAIDYWKRTDRVVKMLIGGAFLGVLLAEIPGALIGGLLAALYAWFSDERPPIKSKI